MEDVIYKNNLIKSNLVKIPKDESFHDFLLHKGPWLESIVGKKMMDWSIISTGYIWFKRKEDKIMFILRWES